MRLFRDHPSLIVVFLVLLALFAYSLRSYSRWNADFYSGKITGIDSVNVVLQSPDGKAVRLRTSSKTRIHYGRDTTTLTLGQLVFAAGTMNADGVVEVTEIRVVEDLPPLRPTR